MIEWWILGNAFWPRFSSLQNGGSTSTAGWDVEGSLRQLAPGGSGDELAQLSSLCRWGAD